MCKQIIITTTVTFLKLFWEIFTTALAVDFSLEFEWQQVSRTLLTILVDLNAAIVWMVTTHPLISKSSSPSTNPLVNVPRALITIGTTVTFMFHSLFGFFLSIP